MRENVHLYTTLDSTNIECRRLAAQGAPSGTVVIARRQTAGRGRLGRHFESPEGLGIYLSVLWRPACPPEQLLPLTALVAVAALRAIETTCPIPCRIKWPNDIVINGKKIAGILTESALEPSGTVAYVIAGIGINVGQTPADFSPEVAAIASSVSRELGQPVSREALTGALIEELDTLYAHILPRPALWREEYRRHCLNMGQTVQLLRGETQQTARVVDIDGQFGLMVEYDDGRQETVRSGEVSVRGLYGYAE